MKKKSASPSGFFNLRALIIFLLCAAAVCSVLTVPLLAFFHAEGTAKVSRRALTFEERVSYQRAIEEVYWRHRIWPKERPDPKPSFDAVMSQAQLEKKVAEYLRNSQALQDYWQRPITAEQLQAEMDRMARHTRQPDVLRELFDALGNDPFVIAECLARPVLAERLVTNWYAYDQRIHGKLKQRAEAELQAHSSVEQMRQLSGKYGETDLVRSDSAQDKAKRDGRPGIKLNCREWDETAQKLMAMFGDANHARTETSGAPIKKITTGPLSPLQEDQERYYTMAVIETANDHLKLATVEWRKEPLKSWLASAENQFPKAVTNPLGNYRLPTISDGPTGCTGDTWSATSGPPDGREGHTAVWTGSEMIVWGGEIYSTLSFRTGGRYNPDTDTWTLTSTANVPSARAYHTAVWTGSEMIVWGGRDENFDPLNTGGRYNPGTDSWTSTNTTNAPAERESHIAVWTGSEMIVWGGVGNVNYLNTGGRYNPNTDSWTATSITNAPSARFHHTAVWTGSAMIVWGGFDGSSDLNTGARYNPATNSWTATSIASAPTERELHTAVWTGSEMIVWGGFGSLNTGGRYNPGTNTWTATGTTNAPDGRDSHTAVWTGSEMIVWGGVADGLTTDTGGKYNPSTNSWTATSMTNAPSARVTHTALWTGNEMIVWGGSFGGVGLNTGGRFNPSTNGWTHTGTNNAPSARFAYTAAWTGDEMIIWGGGEFFYTGAINTGARYNPITDSWTSTNTNNAPSARVSHTAVWTGSEMIVWGGEDNNFSYLNTGGRYNPDTNSWAATSTAGAPEGRVAHAAVWDGQRNDRVGWLGGFRRPKHRWQI